MKNIKILHIDDSIYDRKLVKDALEIENSHFEIDEADSRDKFIRLLNEGKYDLILSDFNILGFDGLQVLEKVKEICPDIPVIIVTGTGSEEVAIEAMKKGASDYVIKSVNHIRGLAHSINNVLENKAALEEKKKALEKLKESEETYKSIFNNSGVAIMLTDPTGTIYSANQKACDLFGYTEEEIYNLGRKGIVDIKDPNLPVLLEKREKYGFASGELTFIRKNGESFPAETASVLFKDSIGNVRSSLIIRDISKQKADEWRIRLLSNAVEQSPNAIAITNNKGQIEIVNKKFSEEYQLKDEDIIGKLPQIFVEDSDINPNYKYIWETINAGGVWSGEALSKRNDGSRFWEEVIVSPILNEKGETGNYVIIMINITEKKKMIDELIFAKEKAEESDKLKTAFLHNISHEIRTPMNAIIGFSNFLVDPEISDEKKKYFSEIVVKSSKQLLAIITDIINIATIEAGQEKINNGKVNLNAIIRLLYEQFKDRYEDKKITLESSSALPDGEDEFITDETKLVEVLTNLLGNALKFTIDGIVKYGYNIGNKEFIFYVKDSGIGIPIEKHEYIFKRFGQLENPEIINARGSGLGLSISKEYIEMMGGKMWLDSEVNKGTTFYFTIPFNDFT